jgi:transposase
MRDIELYEGILGLRPPWKVEEVKLDTNNKLVEVKVGYKEGTLWASEAGERLPVYDHVERRWRHLDTCGFETLIVCRVPRVQLPSGKAETVPVPWAGKRSRFTLLYERFAIEVPQRERGIGVVGAVLGSAPLDHGTGRGARPGAT